MMSRRVRLGDVVEINPSVKPTGRPDDLVSFIAMADVSEEGHVVSVQQRPLAVVQKGYTAFLQGDVLLAKITPCFENGKAALVSNLPTKYGFGSTEFHVLRPERDVDPKFLFHLLWNDRFRRLGAARMTGSAGQKRVPVAFLTDYEFFLPPLEEQQRIAAILDKADSLRRKRREAIRLADKFLRAVFFDLFGDPVANSRAWPERTISEVGTVTTGNTPDRSVEANFGNAIEWIKSDNINTPSHWLTQAREGLSEQGLKGARTAPASSTLMTCIAGSPSCIGNVALADRKVAFNQQINAVTPKSGIDPRFMYALLLFSKPRIQAASTNSMKGMVSKGALEKVRLIWPPEALQERFARIFETSVKLRARMDQAKQAGLYDALQAKLLA